MNHRRRLRELRDRLDGARGAANDGNALAGRIKIRIPRCRMHRLAGEVPGAGKMRGFRLVQRPHAVDHKARLDGIAVGESRRPKRPLRIP